MPTRDQEIALLRQEIEMLMGERQALLQVAGAAAVLIATLDSKRLPLQSVEAADLVATTINALTEETLQDALASVRAEIEGDEGDGEAGDDRAAAAPEGSAGPAREVARAL